MRTRRWRRHPINLAHQIDVANVNIDAGRHLRDEQRRKHLMLLRAAVAQRQDQKAKSPQGRCPRRTIPTLHADQSGHAILPSETKGFGNSPVSSLSQFSYDRGFDNEMLQSNACDAHSVVPTYSESSRSGSHLLKKFPLALQRKRPSGRISNVANHNLLLFADLPKLFFCRRQQ